MNVSPSQPSHRPSNRPSNQPSRPLRLAVLCPHFAPDVAPTGEVMTRIVLELAARGHELHVVTALPWYQHHRIEPGWEGRLLRRERTAWGSITRVHPFPGPDKSSIPRRALGFAGFSALAALAGLRGGRVDGVLAMSPPLTLGLTGWLVHLKRRGPLVFNIQDVFPDAARETGAITNRHVLRVASWLERVSYGRSAAVTVLSDDLRDNVAAKVAPARRALVRVIPNFVDTDAIRPLDRLTVYRAELGIDDEPVVMYAGNVGFSQSLDLLLAAARELPEVTFLVNGGGSARLQLMDDAAGLANVRFGPFQPKERLAEVLATGDVHVVPLRAGLARVSVPSKTYSILAAGRPVLAAIDPGTEVPRILERSGAGVAVPPDDPAAFVAALRTLLADPSGLAAMGTAGRSWVEGWASPAAVARAYEELFAELGDRRPRRRPVGNERQAVASQTRG
jgi:colanic acid biosynthesis glycosyl transferase WcaI